MVTTEGEKPCSACGLSLPLSSYYLEKGKPRGRCKTCHKAVAYSTRVPGANNEYLREYRKTNPVPAEVEQARHRAKYEANKSYYVAKEARRRAHKLKATPSWVDKEHLRMIYELREAVSNFTGIIHHVDHEVPLKGKNVSGLHVPWNLRVIPAVENLSKGNRLVASAA